MDTIVLKFGGSSVADNLRLNLVANRIIELYNEGNNVVVVVSAQGKTTDGLIKEAKELSALPDERELDVLLSSGEQMSMAKLSILLKRLGYNSISLTGWQAGIYTSIENGQAKIENIDTSRIANELKERKIVIVAGFQGINENGDITTLGRGGSDTTAVAIAATLEAKHCYIFSDVDGVYTTDPNKVTIAKKLETLSYSEMLDVSSEGAKVLHNRCVELGMKYKVPIVTKSTFNNKPGTIISDKMESTSVKSIVKNDNIMNVTIKYEKYSNELFNKIYLTLLDNGIIITNFKNNSNNTLNLSFIIKSTDFSKFNDILEKELNYLDCTYYNISKIAIIGQGIMNNTKIIRKCMDIINLNDLEVLTQEINESKIVITFKINIEDYILEQFHRALIK